MLARAILHSSPTRGFRDSPLPLSVTKVYHPVGTGCMGDRHSLHIAAWRVVIPNRGRDT